MKKKLPFLLFAYFMFVLVMISILGYMNQHDVLSSLGIGALSASAFILLTTPHAESAKTTSILWGYVIGSLVGVFWHYVAIMNFWVALGGSPDYIFDFFEAISVVSAATIMMRFRLFHPPAVGLAYGFVIQHWDYRVVILIWLAISLLLLIRHLSHAHLIAMHD